MILQPDVSHSGFYQCLVENEAGFELAFGRLKIYLQSKLQIFYYFISLIYAMRVKSGALFSCPQFCQCE